MSSRRGSKGRRTSQPGEDTCGGAAIEPEIATLAESLMQDAADFSGDVYVELGVRFDADRGRPTALAHRVDASTCGRPGCPYRFCLIFPHDAAGDALSAAASHAQTRGTIARYLAHLNLRGACRVYATSVAWLCEDSVRAHDPAAFELLRALRDAGSDLVVIRARDGTEPDDTMTIVFTGSFGQTVDVEDEGVALYEGRRWHCLPAPWTNDAPRVQRPRQLVAWPRAPFAGWSATRTAVFVAWEAAVAYLVSKFAEPLLAAAGTPVAVPLVPVVLASLLVGWLIGAKLLAIRESLSVWFASTFGRMAAVLGALATLQARNDAVVRELGLLRDAVERLNDLTDRRDELS